MRHSRAVSGGPRLFDDARWLTAEGRALASTAGIALADHATVDCIISSPICRAVQTAELVAQSMNWQGEIQCVSALRSDGSPYEALQALGEIAFEHILVVTHEPIVSALVCATTDANLGSFQVGEIRHVTGNELKWVWTPSRL